MTTRAVARTPARTRSRLVETLLGEVGAARVSVDGGVSSSTWPPGVVSSEVVVVSVQFSHRVLIETELVVVVVVSVQLMHWVLIEPVWVVVVSVVSSEVVLSSEVVVSSDVVVVVTVPPSQCDSVRTPEPPVYSTEAELGGQLPAPRVTVKCHEPLPLCVQVPDCTLPLIVRLVGLSPVQTQSAVVWSPVHVSFG